MKHATNRISFILTIECLIGLAVGIAYEVRTHDLLFENYLSAFFGWAWIFGVINYITRPRIPPSAATPPPNFARDSDAP